MLLLIPLGLTRTFNLGLSRLKDSQFRPQIRNLLELSISNLASPKLGPSATLSAARTASTVRVPAPPHLAEREQMLAGGHGHAHGRTMAMVDPIGVYGQMGLAELSLIALRNGAAGDGRRPQDPACQRTKGSCFRPVVPLVASANGGGWEAGMCHLHGVTTDSK
jgi:hypothetical protein